MTRIRRRFTSEEQASIVTTLCGTPTVHRDGTRFRLILSQTQPQSTDENASTTGIFDSGL